MCAFACVRELVSVHTFFYIIEACANLSEFTRVCEIGVRGEACGFLVLLLKGSLISCLMRGSLLRLNKGYEEFFNTFIFLKTFI